MKIRIWPSILSLALKKNCATKGSKMVIEVTGMPKSDSGSVCCTITTSSSNLQCFEEYTLGLDCQCKLRSQIHFAIHSKYLKTCNVIDNTCTITYKCSHHASKKRTFYLFIHLKSKEDLSAISAREILQICEHLAVIVQYTKRNQLCGQFRDGFQDHFWNQSRRCMYQDGFKAPRLWP